MLKKELAHYLCWSEFGELTLSHPSSGAGGRGSRRRVVPSGSLLWLGRGDAGGLREPGTLLPLVPVFAAPRSAAAWVFSLR